MKALDISIGLAAEETTVTYMVRLEGNPAKLVETRCVLAVELTFLRMARAIRSQWATKISNRRQLPHSQSLECPKVPPRPESA